MKTGLFSLIVCVALSGCKVEVSGDLTGTGAASSSPTSLSPATPAEVTVDLSCTDAGLVNPIPDCSEEYPCTDLLGLYANQTPPVTVLTNAGTEPSCKTGNLGNNAGRVAYDDGAAQQWIDGDGVTRYFCQYLPSNATPSHKAAVIVYFHGSGGRAQDVYDLTSLRDKARPGGGAAFADGFILVAPHARNLHWPTINSQQDGSKWDTFYRDYDHNEDVLFVDAIIDGLIASGNADPDRIYLMGWSNGARFAHFYGLHRRDFATPGANRIAAIANYSGGDPFSNVDDGVSPSCQASHYPSTDIPVFLVTRSCDLMACSDAQELKIESGNIPVPPGNNMQHWVAQLQQITPNATWRKIDDYGQTAASCALTAYCTANRALVNHLRWPDGHVTSSTKDVEPDMLSFLSTKSL